MGSGGLREREGERERERGWEITHGDSVVIICESLNYWLQSILHKKATVHQVTIMLATSKNVLFPGYNHLLTTSADDLTLLIIARAPASEGG